MEATAEKYRTLISEKFDYRDPEFFFIFLMNKVTIK